MEVLKEHVQSAVTTSILEPIQVSNYFFLMLHFLTVVCTAVIMLIHSPPKGEEYCLLGRQKVWEKGELWIC